MDKLKSEYYEMAIRGDFQNETDIIDIDSVWKYFEKHLSEIQYKLETSKFDLEIAKKKNEGNYKENISLQQELSEQRKITENYKKQWEANSCTVANLADEIEALKKKENRNEALKEIRDRKYESYEEEVNRLKLQKNELIGALEQLNVFNDRQELLEFVDKVCQEHNNGGLQ